MNPLPFFFDVDGGAVSRVWLAAGWTMLHFLWLGAAIGAVAWLARRVLRPFGPQVCYVVLLLMLLVMAGGAIRLGVWVFDRMPAPISVDFAVPSATAVAVQQPAAVSQFAAPSPPPPVVTPADALRQEGQKWLGEAARFAPWVWLVGSPATLLFLALGLAGAGRLRRQSQLLVTGEIADAARRLATVMRVSRHVTVAVCDRVVAPMLLGILRPLILLPPAVLAGHSATQIEMILIHELAHVRRFDNFVNLVQRVIEALLFFHPAVWLVSRWVRLEREHCCDAVVLAHTGDPQTYAETLAALAIPGLAPAHAAAAMANHQLVTRIRQILNIEERSMTVSGKMLSFVGSLVVVTGLIVAAYAQSSPPEAAPDAKAQADKPPANPIDQYVLEKFLTQSLVADKDADDATFYRRRMLDLTGTLPSPEDLKKFLNDKSPEKRQKLVRQLLTDAFDAESATYVLNILQAERALEQSELLNHETRAVANPSHAKARDQKTVAEATDQASPLLHGIAFLSTSAEKRPYSAQQLIGPPDALMGRTSESAWCSLTADDQEEWLELDYAEPVYAVAILFYENACPGALSQVQVHSAEQPGLSFTWADRDPTARTATHGVSVIPLTNPMKTKRIKVTLDSKGTPGWNEVDAVGLLDHNGKVHWVASAKASSTYADTTYGRAHPHTGSALYSGSSDNRGIVRYLPGVGGVVKQGDALVTISDAQPKPSLCYVILQQENGQDKIIRCTLDGGETVLDLVAKVAPDVHRAGRPVWILRPGVGDNSIDQILRVNHEAIRQGDAKTNFKVQSGDRIFVGGATTKPDPNATSALDSGTVRLSPRRQTPQDALAGWLTGTWQQAAQDQAEKARAAALAAKEAAQKKRSAETRNPKHVDDPHNSDDGKAGTLPGEPTQQRLWRELVQQQRLTAEAERAAAQKSLAEAETKKLHKLLEDQQALIQSLRDQLDKQKASPKSNPGDATPASSGPPTSPSGNQPVRPPTITPPAPSAQPGAEWTQLQKHQFDLLRHWIADDDAKRPKPATATARVTIKALLGQSATAAFSGVKQFQNVTVDAKETAFASIAEPNEIIVCGKRLGKAQVHAHDADGKLYVVEIEFVEPQPPKPATP
jgi:beta-lactamase regulating signal transducer with metallopeptidase domain